MENPAGHAVDVWLNGPFESVYGGIHSAVGVLVGMAGGSRVNVLVSILIPVRPRRVNCFAAFVLPGACFPEVHSHKELDELGGCGWYRDKYGGDN